MVISSHSSHIAKEVDFKDLRYFKRIAPIDKCSIPTSSVINLSGVFGTDDDTTRFITRYIQTTHCDLFFADAVILVEGAAEYMLVPHFIRENYPELNERYISILEINGRHSQRLKPLIEKLCLPTLIITDIDSGKSDGHHSHTIPKRNKGIISTNYAITKWIINEDSLDTLLDLPENKKILELCTPYNFKIRMAFQTPIKFNYYGTDVEAIASTFEDCLVYTNFELFKSTDGEGLINSIHELCNDNLKFEDFNNEIYELFRGKNVPKAEFALDLIYSIDPNELKVPKYIDCGLRWLQELLINRD
ncbi:ATP-dependent nuclease [Clostridium butyricum]|uniref:ATP-dependent nuclease n=1 Tax=Clostridium butyricum TaxID=1492 RepID=UPI0038CDC7A9